MPSKVAAVLIGVLAFCDAGRLSAAPLSAPATAQTIADVTPEMDVLLGHGAVLTSTGDPDVDATLAASNDAQKNGVMAVKAHEADLLRVLADMPDPFVREVTRKGVVVYRADSMYDCVAHATAAAQTHPGEKRPGGKLTLDCAGNPFPMAAMMLGSYYNEIGQSDSAIAVLDRGLVAGPNSPTLISERNAALIVLHRWDELLAGADRGLAIANLAPRDHARLLRNRGYALTELKRLDEAQGDYETSLQLDPTSELAHHELAYIAGLKRGAAPTPSGGLIPLAPKPPN